jgi:hypothetical protein
MARPDVVRVHGRGDPCRPRLALAAARPRIPATTTRAPGRRRLRTGRRPVRPQLAHPRAEQPQLAAATAAAGGGGGGMCHFCLTRRPRQGGWAGCPGRRRTARALARPGRRACPGRWRMDLLGSRPDNLPDSETRQQALPSRRRPCRPPDTFKLIHTKHQSESESLVGSHGRHGPGGRVTVTVTQLEVQVRKTASPATRSQLNR